MRLLIGGRLSGKTRRLVQWTITDPRRLLLVTDHHTRRGLLRRYHDQGLGPDQVEVVLARPAASYRDRELAVDDLPGVLALLLRQQVTVAAGDASLTMLTTDVTGEEEPQPEIMRSFGGPRPEIVVLCGSTRHRVSITEAASRLTAAGAIVLGMDPVPDTARDLMDELHRRKIDLADRVHVVDVGGYIGESTRAEITYAEQIGRPISYLSTERGTP